jgi:hypothetical protein
MDFQLARLRRGEWITGVAAIVLLLDLFLLPWYGLTGVSARVASGVGIDTSITGWHEFTHLRWLILLTIVAALALVFLEATRRAPALPVSFSVFVTVLGAVTSVWLIYRVLIEVPGSGGMLEQKPAAYIGLASTLVLTGGAFLSMREETRPDPARNAEITVVRLGDP